MDTHEALIDFHVRPGTPDFLGLPWQLPLARWPEACGRQIVEVDRGLSRHDVLFMDFDGAIYAFKEVSARGSESEFEMLRQLEERKLPAVVPVGCVRARLEDKDGGKTGVLITRYLESSLPFRTMLMNERRERFRDLLFDAVASLLVRLHVAGFYWGDCSLSNTLFRRDADVLMAFLVDAEASAFPERLTDGQRAQDLLIMMDNVAVELGELSGAVDLPHGIRVHETGAIIRDRYQQLWDEITREEIIPRTETYRIQQRIRKLQDLGFSVDEVELVPAGGGNQLRVRTIVADRDYHRHTLHSLTGLVAGNRESQLMLNEIRELGATLSRELNRNVPMSMAAYRWLQDRFNPAVQLLTPLVTRPRDIPEKYCQVLEHKWYLSERAQQDVGFERAIADFVKRFQPD